MSVKEMLKIKLQEGFKFIARDENGDIYVYENVPNKSIYGEWKGGGKLKCVGTSKFLPLITPNEKPIVIVELIK